MQSRAAPDATFLPTVLVAAVLAGAVISCGSATLKPMDASGGSDGGGTSGSDGGGMGGTALTDAGRDADSSSCVDTTSDGKNCGTCGHDCLGGTCTGGQCQPLLLAQYVGNMMIIAVAPQAVYATIDSGFIGRAKKDGSDVKPFARPGFAASVFSGTFVAEDGDRTFFVRGSPLQVSYCAVMGCDATVMPIGGAYSQYFAVEQTNHKIFWLDYSPTQIWAASTAGTISGTALPGGSLATGSNVSGLFYNGGGVFVSDEQSIARLPAVGGVAPDCHDGNQPSHHSRCERDLPVRLRRDDDRPRARSPAGI